MKPSRPRALARSLCTGALLGATAAAAQAADDPAATMRALLAQNRQLEQSLARLQQQMREVQQALAALAPAAAPPSSAATAAPSDNAAPARAEAQAARKEARERLSLWGYGEIYYAHPTHGDEPAEADLARAVFGIGYRFDELTRFNSEFEIEHAVASSSDPGEFEVEQFHVEHQLGESSGLRAGLFLIPAGLLNENHEPTRFYGVQRNFVETLIIPSTWREGGLSLFGTSAAGLDWNIGLTTGPDLSKWDFTPESPLYTSALSMIASGAAPMQATHQELAFANARHLSQYASLDWRGVPGLTLGGSVFSGLAEPATPFIGSQRVSLAEAHARLQSGRWDLSALAARGTISNAGAANALYPGTANPMPSAFDGWYLQAAYNLWQSGSRRLTPFVRVEHYDMGAKYEGIAPGYPTTPTAPVPNPASPGTLVNFALPRDQVTTLGANYYLTPNVVFKFDFQHFRNNTDFTRWDLGLGLEF